MQHPIRMEWTALPVLAGLVLLAACGGTGAANEELAASGNKLNTTEQCNGLEKAECSSSAACEYTEFPCGAPCEEKVGGGLDCPVCGGCVARSEPSCEGLDRSTCSSTPGCEYVDAEVCGMPCTVEEDGSFVCPDCGGCYPKSPDDDGSCNAGSAECSPEGPGEVPVPPSKN